MLKFTTTCALLLLTASSGRAEPLDLRGPVEVPALRAEMHRYFTGERRGGYWLMGAAAPALALGAGLMVREDGYSRGLGYTLLGFGALEAIGGLAFYLNTRRRVPRFDQQLSTDPAAYRAAELPRMRSVNAQMRFLEGLEISMIIAGGAMTGAGLLQKQDLLAGIGTGIMVEALVLLIYDQLAGRRALRYSEALQAGRHPGVE